MSNQEFFDKLTDVYVKKATAYFTKYNELPSIREPYNGGKRNEVGTGSSRD